MSKKDRILFATVGELKMNGIIIPDIPENAPDDNVVTLDVGHATILAEKIVLSWGLQPDQEAMVLGAKTHDRVADILVIEKCLTVLFNGKSEWLKNKNQSFENLSPIEHMIENGSEAIRR